MVKFEGALALVVCALGWSLAGIFIKYADVNSFALAGFRSIIAFITIVCFLKRFPRFAVRNHDDSINRKRTAYLWISGLTYALTMILFCIANKLTYSANAVLLQYTFPIWVISFGPFLLGEKNRKADYLTIAGVIAGMILFFADSLFGQSSGEFAQTEVAGNVFALASGVAFGMTTLFQRKLQVSADEKSNNGKNGNYSGDAFMIAQVFTAVAGLPFVFLLPDGIPDFKSLIFLILLGTLQMGIPNICYAVGIKKVRALSASLITMLEPLMNPVWVLIFYQEIPSLSCIAGGILIMGCVVFREVAGAKSAL